MIDWRHELDDEITTFLSWYDWFIINRRWEDKTPLDLFLSTDIIRILQRLEIDKQMKAEELYKILTNTLRLHIFVINNSPPEIQQRFFSSK